MKRENVNRRKDDNRLSEPVSKDNSLKEKKDAVNNAREEALSDIEEDADLSIHSPNDDLDEGETARLGEDKTDLI